MKKRLPTEDEFYVGYMPATPQHIGSAMRRLIYLLGFAIAGTAAIAAWQQKQFSSSNFEFGIYTTAEGFLFAEPFPHLLVTLGKDQDDNDLYRTILLVGSGKKGADQFLRDLVDSKKISMGSKVRLAGSLIYGNGKAIMQVDEKSNVMFLENGFIDLPKPKTQKTANLFGEIVDPKCYFGVMKPGDGKVHRSCAIRCIAGGIPPVFRTESAGYFILLDERNRRVSPEIANVVGDVIMLEGRIIQWNDWNILQVNSEMIHQLATRKKWKEGLAPFNSGITMCN